MDLGGGCVGEELERAVGDPVGEVVGRVVAAMGLATSRVRGFS